MKSLFNKMLGIVPALAMVLAVSSANVTCHFFLCQPDIPESLKKNEK